MTEPPAEGRVRESCVRAREVAGVVWDKRKSLADPLLSTTRDHPRLRHVFLQPRRCCGAGGLPYHVRYPPSGLNTSFLVYFKAFLNPRLSYLYLQVT